MRGDVGFDATLSADSSELVATAARLCAGVGYECADRRSDNGAISYSGGSEWADTGAVGMHVNAGSVLVYGAIVFPLDHDAHVFMNAALTLGVEGRLR